MATNPIFKKADGTGAIQFDPEKGQLPLISEGLHSVGAWQWELHFYDVPGLGDTQNLTLAAKQVNTLGFSVEDIEVNRVNDKVFYPGKPSPEELTVTFDNLLNDKTSVRLWEWFRNIYDPISGEITRLKDDREGSFKVPKVEVYLLNNKLKPISSIELYGVYPKAWKSSELNYSTGTDFQTIEVTFRYDFMQHKETSPL